MRARSISHESLALRNPVGGQVRPQIAGACGVLLCFVVCLGCGASSGDGGFIMDASVCPAAVADAGPLSASTAFTAATIFAPPQAASLCVALQACFPSEFPKVWTSFSDCVNGGDLTSYFFPQPGDFTPAPHRTRAAIDPAVVDFYNCVLGAGNDCTKVAACLLLDSAVDTCSGGKGLTSGTCNGTLLHGCTADGYPFAVDCARYDVVCVGNFNSCGWATCPSNVSSCDGTRIVKCTVSGKTVTVKDCSSYGADFRCVGGQGGGGCATETACPDVCGYLVCKGSVSVSCDRTRLSWRDDCAQYSRFQRCSQGRCVATGNECDSSVASSCLGTQVVYCDDGFAKTADCSPFGTCSNGKCVRM
jgi:hypothetical protein